MGQQKRNRAQEQRQAFRDQVKALRCPHCEVEFSDAALDWAEAWLEGRFDLMEEAGWQERDGPYKLRCELCGQRSWLNYFTWTVERAKET